MRGRFGTGNVACGREAGFRLAGGFGVVALLACAAALTAQRDDLPYPRFEPTPPEIAREMLKLGGVQKDDVVYDLGSGDGRIVIAAAKDFGARGVGVELDGELVERAQEAARKAGVADRVRFVRQDIFEADFREASVVTLYLLPEVNLALRPKLLRDLRPGTRIVSHSHDMGDWTPTSTRELRDRTGKLHRIHLWTVPKLTDAPPKADAGPRRPVRHAPILAQRHHPPRRAAADRGAVQP